MSQSLEEIEVICVNDGSTDDSADILEEYCQKDARIIIISQRNIGAGAARNAGIRAAKGQYLSFLDADDFFESDMLEKAYNKAVSEDADICIYQTSFFDDVSKEYSFCNFSLKLDRLPSHRPFCASEIQTNPFRVIMGWAWDKLFKHSFITDSQLFFQEQRTTNDLYFVYASILKASKITTVDQQLVYHRRSMIDSLSNTREKSWDCFYKALELLKGEIIQMGLNGNYEQYFVNYALQNCLWQLDTLSASAGAKLFKKLKQNWFAQLGIDGRNEDYFEDECEYKKYMEIVRLDENEYANYIQYSLRMEISSLKKLLRGQDDVIQLHLKELEAIRSSLSFRIGRMITYIPKKLMGK